MIGSFPRRFAIGASCLLLISSVTPTVLAAPSAQQAGNLMQVTVNSTLGPILVNAQGLTLYTLSSEAGAKFQCSAKCLTFWPPLLLPAGMSTPTAGPGVTGALGVAARPDGTQQVTLDGFPLYTFAGDKAPGDTHGQGIAAFGGTWGVVQAKGLPLSATAVQQLVIHITATGGTVWGKVTARYTYHGRQVRVACGQASCRFVIPYGVKVRLSQSPTNAATWPFQQWQIRPLAGQSMNSSQPARSLKMTTNYRVTAVYVVA